MLSPSGSIRKQIVSIVLGIIIALSVSFFVIISIFSSSFSLLEHELVYGQDKVKLALSANVEFKRQVQEWKNVLLRGHDPQKNDKYWKKLNDRHKNVQKHLNKIGTDIAPELSKLIKEFIKDHDALLKAYTEGREVYENSGFDFKAGDKVVSGMDRAPSAALSEIAKQLAVISETSYTDTIDRANSTIFWAFVMIIGLSFLLACFAYIVVGRNIIDPIYTIMAAIQKMSEGDYRATDRIHRRDEIGLLADNIERLREFICSLVNGLDSSVEELGSAAGSIQERSSQIYKGSELQRSRADQVATAVQELSYSAKEIAKNASLTADNTVTTNELAGSGAKAMSDAKSSIKTLVDEIGSASDVIQQLADDTSNVGAVLDVIKGIAEQTNLLALNAAIEAARAGEQGRGFAVVADEVRTLAQRTQQSTAEIQNILESVQTGAQNAVEAMEIGQNRTEQGMNQVQEAGDLMENMTTDIGRIADMNTQVASAAEEQTSVTNEIAQNISEISEVARTSAEVMSGAVGSSDRLRVLAVELQQTLAGFKT